MAHVPSQIRMKTSLFWKNVNKILDGAEKPLYCSYTNKERITL